MKLALLATMWAAYGSFFYVIKFFFRRAGKIGAGMQFISLVGSANMLLSTYLLWNKAEFEGWMPWAGIALFLLSTGLMWGSVRANRAKPLTLAYSTDMPEHLVTWGPYRFIRHPFYASYTLAWLGAFFATASPIQLGTAATLFGLYWRAAWLEENKFLESGLSAGYRTYRRQTGMFVPKPTLSKQKAA